MLSGKGIGTYLPLLLFKVPERKIVNVSGILSDKGIGTYLPLQLLKYQKGK